MFKLKKYQEAIECFDKSIELEPNYSKAYENKGAALYEEAIKCCNKAIKLNQINQNHFKGFAFTHYKDSLYYNYKHEKNLNILFIIILLFLLLLFCFVIFICISLIWF